MLINLPRRFFLLTLLGAVVSVSFPASARPAPGRGNTIPATPEPAAIRAGTEAVENYLNDFGDLSISVVTAGVDQRGGLRLDQSQIIRAIAAEVESQLRKYTGDEIGILAIEVTPERTQRIMARQNKSPNPTDTFVREVAELSSAPYLLTVEVGPADRRGASAGLVTLRLVEVATGRVLNTISSQFYEDKNAYPNVNTAAWVQHSVTYWLNEMMGWDSGSQTVSGGLPKALAGPFLMRLQFVGELPRKERVKLKGAIADAIGIEARKINLRASKENGLDVATADLRVDSPPHFIMDDLVIGIEESMTEAGLTATPLREMGGDVIFAVTNVPAWWALTGGDQGSNVYQAWAEMLEDAGSPSIAVIRYIDPNVAANVGKFKNSAVLVGAGSVLSAAVEEQLRELKADVIAVEPSSLDISRAPWGSVQDVKQALPANLLARAEWAFVIEVIPEATGQSEAKVLGRLVDLQADRVLGSSVFPAAKSAVPPGEQQPDEPTHAARYLVGRTIVQAQAGETGLSVLDLVVTDAGTFDFAERVSRIARGQDATVRTKLPTWQAGNPYSIEIHFSGEAGAFVERLRADLSTLPVTVGQYSEGRLTLVRTDAAVTP